MDKGSGAVRRVPFWRSLQTKFALTYIVIVAAVLILLNTYPLVVSEKLAYQSKQASMLNQASVLASALATGPEALTAEGATRTVELLRGSLGVTRVVVTDPIRVHIFINYFDEWLPEGAKQLIEYDAIMKDERLASLLGMQDSFKLEDEPDLERIEALLERFETETDLNQSDVFYGVFQLIMKSKDEDITLGKIANLMEVLLYLVLNGGLDQDE